MFDPLKSKTKLFIYTTLAFTLGLGGASALGWSTLTAMPTIVQTPQVDIEDVQPAIALSEAFVSIAEAVTPAVIRIEAERPVMIADSGDIPFPLPDFFGDPNGQQPQQPQQPEYGTAGGSGFIVSQDGYILTNNHVVENARTIRVFMSDRREYSAELIGTDPTTDVAVIKIDANSLPTLSFGSTTDVRVGQFVLAVGNPGLGGPSTALDYTVTQGIVSALGRPLQLIGEGLGDEDRNYAIEDFIQTDAVINPGNSGGPLVNVYGQVIGINSAIASRTGYYQGYGFAIPIDLAQRIMEDLVEYGEVRRAYLGISMQGVDPVDAEYYGLPRTMGARIGEVVPDSPADRAGMRAEDIIVELDGVDIERPSQLQVLIAQRRPGDEVTVRYFREGESREVDVDLDRSPLGSVVREAVAPDTRTQERLGIQVGPLGEENASQFGFDEPGGVVILGVNPTGPAARQGIGPGLRILAINRIDVVDVEDVETILEGVQAGDIVNFRTQSPDGRSIVVNVRVPE